MSCEYDCRYCGNPMHIYEIEPHSHTIVNLPDYSGGWFAECTKCSCALTGRTEEDLLEQLGASPFSDPTPLSLEELHNHIGCPVWVDSINMPITSGWEILHMVSPETVYWRGPHERIYDLFENYGKTWLAYAQKPKDKGERDERKQ